MTKNSDAEVIRSLLGGYDPAADVRPSSHMLAAAEQITRQPGVSSGLQRSTARPRLLAAAAGLIAVAVAAGLAAGFGAFSARRPITPPAGVTSRPIGATSSSPHARAGMPRLLAFHVDAGASSERAVLAALAASAARLPGLGHGRYFYVQSRTWGMGTTVVSKNKSCSVFSSGVGEQWIARNGSGREASRTTSLTPPDACGTGQKLGSSNKYFGPGKLALMYRDRLSSDPAVLRRQLDVGHPVSDGTAEFLTAVNDVYLEQPVRPAVAVAIVKLVSQEPGIRYDGTTTDRAGRPGIGYSIESSYSGLPTQYLVVFDAKTGQLLDSEQILNKRAGLLNIPVPSVISYDLFVKSGVTNHD